MGELIYSAIASLDGYTEDADGDFSWGTPDEEVHGFINDLERPIGTYLYGRRMYDTMLYWESNSLEGQPDFVRDFTAIWRGADKVVFSRTLTDPASARTRIERAFDADAVRRLKTVTPRALSVSGADLAGQAIRAGLVDELRLFTVPVVVGGGKAWLPKDLHLDVHLAETRRFASGVAYSRYTI